MNPNPSQQTKKRTTSTKHLRKTCRERNNFVRRRSTLLRKAGDLATLSGAKVCLVSYDDDGELHTWPENPTEAADIITTYMKNGRSMEYTRTRKLDLCGFLAAKKRKVEEKEYKVLNSKIDIVASQTKNKIDAFSAVLRICTDNMLEESQTELISYYKRTAKSLVDRINFMRNNKRTEAANKEDDQDVLYLSCHGNDLEATPSSYTGFLNSDNQRDPSCAYLIETEAMGCGSNHVASTSNCMDGTGSLGHYKNTGSDGTKLNGIARDSFMNLGNNIGCDMMDSNFMGLIGTNNSFGIMVPYNKIGSGSAVNCMEEICMNVGEYSNHTDHHMKRGSGGNNLDEMARDSFSNMFNTRSGMQISEMGIVPYNSYTNTGSRGTSNYMVVNTLMNATVSTCNNNMSFMDYSGDLSMREKVLVNPVMPAHDQDLLPPMKVLPISKFPDEPWAEYEVDWDTFIRGL